MKKITLIIFSMLFGIAVNAQYVRAIDGLNITNHQQNGNQQIITTPSFPGDGTENNPYLISTPENLTELSTLVNGGNNFSGKYFQMSSNIDMSSISNFTPIGTSVYLFSGIFDGNNFIISNLTVTGNLYMAGLFGAITGTPSLIAKVKNLGIENVSVTGDFTGGLVGYICQNTEINSCYTIIGQGGINGTSNSYGYLGGLVGAVEVYSNSTISNCYSKGGTISGPYSVGGLIGTLYGNGQMTNCYSSNNVIGNNYVGGFIGLCANTNNSISNSYAAGNVTYTSAGGGFLGYNSNSISNITNCYYRENNVTNGIVLSGVTPMSATSMQTDQFATTLNASQNPAPWLRSTSINDGYPYLFEHPAITGTGTLVNPYIVENSNNLNTVANRVNGGSQPDAVLAFRNGATIVGTGNNSIGGATPFTGKVVFVDGAGNPVNNGSVTINGITNPLFGNTDGATINKITLTGVNINSSSDNVGALVNIANNSVIDSCYSSGNVTGNNNVGGLIGNGNSCTHITNCYSTANVTGVEYVGGLIGKMDGCSVRKSYAIGNVSGNDKVGGLLGSNDRGTVLKCYSKGNVIRIAGGAKLFGKLIGTGAGNEIGCFYLITATSPNDAMSNYRGTASSTPEEALN